MYNGKMTEELNELYDIYYNIFHEYPDCYEELEYGQNTYKEYIKDIKMAIDTKKELVKFVDVEIDVDW